MAKLTTKIVLSATYSLLAVIFFLCTPTVAHAQLGPAADRCTQGICSGYGAPGGACANGTGQVYTDLSTTPATQYTCKNQAWSAVGGSGSGSSVICGVGCTITNIGGQLRINILPQIGSLVGVSLGVNPPFNGWTPFLSSDLHRTDITNSPIDPTNVGFQAMYGTRGMDVDASPYINVVDSANQAGTWYSIQPEEDYADAVQIFLTGNEVIEGQNAIINAFTCWNDNGQGDGGDHHLIVYDKATGFAYETYQWQLCNGIGKPYSSKVWNLNISADHQNAYGMDSTDAAGLIFSEGMIRYDEVASGTINHAVRFTAPNASRAFYRSGSTFCANVAPATHYSRDKCLGDPTTTPFGLAYGDRLRLKASFDVSGYTPQTQTILNAYKKYGLFFADTGGFYAQFAFDTRYDFDGIAQIKTIPLSNYEKVTVGSDGLYSVDSTDDANGIDSVLFKPYAQTATGTTPPYAVSFPILANPYNRPTINSFTGVCSGGTLSACPVGSAVTLTLNDTHGVVHFTDNTPPFAGNTVSVVPAQTTTYTPYSRGIYGFTKGSPITVTMTGPVAPQPTADVTTGTYVVPKNVSLSNTLAGSQIRYTLDGTTPNLYSPIFTTPLSVQETTTLKAITGAVSLGYLTSPVSTYTYTLNLPPAGAPVFSVPGGTYTTAQTIGMTSTTSGAPIYYTLDGSVPKNSSTLYSAPVILSPIAGVQTRTALKAATIFYGYGTTYTNATYLLGQQEALDGTVGGSIAYTTGKFAQAATSFGTGDRIILPPGFSPLNSTTGYTIGAWLKTTFTGSYSMAFNLNDSRIFMGVIDGEFAVSSTGTDQNVKSGILINDNAWHFCKGVFDSTGVHPFCDGVAGTSHSGHDEPAIGQASIGSYNNVGQLTWGDGSIDELFVKNLADSSTTVPTSAFTGSETGMWALYHLDNDTTDSTVRSSGPAASSPTFSPAAGAYARPQNVTLSTTTSGGVIHYSTTGTASCASTVYTGPVTVSAGSTVSATTTAAGYSCSPVANAAYTFTGPSLPTTNLAVRFEAQNSVGSSTTVPAGTGTTTTGALGTAVTSSIDTVGLYSNRSWDFSANTGNQYAFLSTPAPYAAGYTVCAVFKTDNTVSQSLTTNNGGNGLWFFPAFSGNNPRLYLVSQDAFATANATTNTWSDVCGSYDQTTGAYSFVVNGTPAGSGTKSASLLSDPINLVFMGTGGSNPFVGKLAGLYIYTAPVDSTTMTAIQAYFSNNFGTH